MKRTKEKKKEKRKKKLENERESKKERKKKERKKEREHHECRKRKRQDLGMGNLEFNDKLDLKKIRIVKNFYFGSYSLDIV